MGAAESSKDRVLADTHWLTSGTVNEFPGQVRDREWLLAQLGGKSLSQVLAGNPASKLLE